MARRNQMTLEALESALRIDDTDIDRCLMEQPDLFYQTAIAAERAVSVRDEAKLRLEQKMAELDRSVREKAAAEEEKITEAGIRNKLMTLPRIKELNAAYLEAKEKAGKWAALKEAYRERSFMLRELVSRQIAQWHDTGIERGNSSVRSKRADAINAAAGQMRRRRLADTD